MNVFVKHKVVNYPSIGNIFLISEQKYSLSPPQKERNTALKGIRQEDRLYSSTYAGYLLRRLRNGGVWSTVTLVYKKIRKYALISGIVRYLAFVITLLEKSALLLLAVSSFFVLLPAIVIFAALFSAICVVRYLKLHKTVKSWLTGAKRATVYMTSEKCYGKTRNPLFLRCAMAEAADYDHPVIVLCSDRIISAKWYSFNLLAVRPDYFFILKKHYFRRFSVNITYISLS